ncbi:MAG: class I SAM-dependent methyltransferase, partial [Paracoccaceae bacterium]
MSKVTTACPCCNAPLLPPFYETGPVPVHSCLMLDTAADALSFPTGHLSLAACPSCGFVTNTLFDAKWSAYAPEYEDQQSYSPTFNAFAAQLAQDVIKRHNLHHKSALEVGCSKGDFLSLLCEHGAMQTVGIDPGAVAGRIAPPKSGSLRLINDYYSAKHLKYRADLLCCRHTLEHIRPVHQTLALMHRHMRQNPGAVLLIEVPDATRIWQQLAFEDIYYEHCSYFTAASLAAAV